MNRFRKQQEQEKQDAIEPERKKPMREYTNDSQATSPSMLFFRFEVTAYWLVPLIIFCVILFGGIFVVIKYDVFDKFEATNAPPSYYKASGEINVPGLLEAYIHSVGGRDALESIRSIRYKGRLVETTGKINFQILISLPDKGMIITEPGEDYSQKLVLNGEQAWQVVGLGNGKQKTIPLTEADALSLAWSLRVHNTFRRLALEKSRETKFAVQEIEFSGRPCLELTTTLPDGGEFLAVLDKESLRLLKSVEAAPGMKGMERLEAVYADHRSVSGIVLPFQTKTYKQGELYNVSYLSAVEINPGLISSLFEVPEQLSK